MRQSAVRTDHTFILYRLMIHLSDTLQQPQVSAVRKHSDQRRKESVNLASTFRKLVSQILQPIATDTALLAHLASRFMTMQLNDITHYPHRSICIALVGQICTHFSKLMHASSSTMIYHLVLGDSPNRTNFDAGAQMQARALAIVSPVKSSCRSIAVLEPFIVVILQGELSVATAHDMGNLSPVSPLASILLHDFCIWYQRRTARTAQAISASP